MSEENWQEKLPETVRASSLMNGVDSEEKFWKRVQDQHSFAGNSIRIPSDDAGEEAIAEFREKLKNKIPSLMEVPADADDEAYAAALKKLGRPEKADDYVAPELDNYKLSDEELAFLRDTASASDMTKRQFNRLCKKFVEGQSEQKAGYEKVRGDDAALLKKEWGALTEDRQKEVIAFAKNSGAPEHLVKAIESGKARASELLWIHSLMGASKETAAVAAQDGENTAANAGKLTPYEAEEKLAEIYNNKSHPYHRAGGDVNHPAVKRVMELIQMTA